MPGRPPDDTADNPPERPALPGAPIAWLTVGVGLLVAVLLAVFEGVVAR